MHLFALVGDYSILFINKVLHQNCLLRGLRNPSPLDKFLAHVESTTACQGADYGFESLTVGRFADLLERRRVMPETLHQISALVIRQWLTES